VLMIPGLTMLLGRHQHLYQAAAMVANVAVAVPAAMRHHRAGATVSRVLRWMLPAALVFVLVGVWVSNLPLFEGQDGGIWLGRVLAGFMAYVIYVNVRRLFAARKDGYSGESLERAALSPVGSGTVGAMMGTTAGLLGVGGGAIAVPMQQILLRLPLRNAIANSSAVMCVSATLGAIYKIGSLDQHGYGWGNALVLAGLLAPTCWIGGRIGAALTHRLPVRQVRVAFIGLMLVAMWKMANIPLPFLGE